MNIVVLIDFSVIGNVIDNKIKFNENLDRLNKISSIYEVVCFATSEETNLFKSLNISNKVNVYEIENIETKEKMILEASQKNEWVLYFKEGIEITKREDNIIYSPIYLKGNLDVFKNISFTEHAKYKKYYHDFSDYYMYTLANDTVKEAQFLANCFKKYLNKDTGKVLDCCCGVGRHTYLMAKNNFKVTGFDFSEDQIRNAKKFHNHPNIEYLVMDARNFNLETKDYDMSYCMWTTYNYLSLTADLKKFIISNYNHQKEGGILILDSKNIPCLQPHRMYNRYTEKGKFRMEILINKYVSKNIQNSQYFLFIDDAGIKKFFFDDEFVRFYTIKELQQITNGYYEVIDTYGDFDMNEYQEDSSNRFIVILRRI